MAIEPQREPPPDERRDVDGRPQVRSADIAPLGPRGANPLHLHTPELDVLRGLQAAGQFAQPDDPVWDELEALGLVETQLVRRPDGSPIRCGMLTSLGRRYRTD